MKYKHSQKRKAKFSILFVATLLFFVVFSGLYSMFELRAVFFQESINPIDSPTYHVGSLLVVVLMLTCCSVLGFRDEFNTDAAYSWSCFIRFAFKNSSVIEIGPIAEIGKKKVIYARVHGACDDNYQGFPFDDYGDSSYEPGLYTVPELPKDIGEATSYKLECVSTALR